MSRMRHPLEGLFIVVLALSTSGFSASDSLLTEAARNGDEKTLHSLLKERVDVNASSPDGTTALAWAAHRDDLEVVGLLIAAGADANLANDYGMTPLILACGNASAAVVKSLLKSGADPNTRLATGETVLMQCVRTGNTEAVRALLAHGADVNASENEGQTALMWAAAEGHTEVVRLLLEQGGNVHAKSKGGFTALLFASRAGDESSVEALLNAKADVNYATQEGMTALLIASANGHESLSIQLLNRGANPNAADSDGMTALHHSVLKGFSNIGGAQPDLAITSYRFRPDMLELAKALLAHGANPNVRLKRARRIPFGNTPRFSLVGATPFFFAAGASDVELMRMLIEKGADPLLGTETGVTSLMVAAGLGRYQDIPEEEATGALEAVKLTVQLGNDVNAIGENRYTALHGAAYVGANPIIRYLVEIGGKLNVKDDFAQTPLSIAKGVIGANIVDFSKKPFGPHPSASSLLIQFGATE
jgi:uncharacterized protein